MRNSIPRTGPLCRFWCDERGGTAIEYALVAAGVAVAISGAVSTLGDTVFVNLYQRVADAMAN